MTDTSGDMDAALPKPSAIADGPEFAESNACVAAQTQGGKSGMDAGIPAFLQNNFLTHYLASAWAAFLGPFVIPLFSATPQSSAYYSPSSYMEILLSYRMEQHA
jgi:hypothetical protein